MGTPSGSKNAAVFTDRLQLVGQQDFESGVVDASCEDAMIKAGCHDVNDGSRYSLAADRKMKASEEQEFRQAKSGARIEQKMNFMEKIVPKAHPVGPAPEKRKLPAFVKLKSKDAQGATGGEEPEQLAKAPRIAPEEGSAPLRSPESGTASSPCCGGLVAYGSDDEDED